RHAFPLDAEYDIKISIASYRGAFEPQTLEVAIDGARLKLFTVTPRMQPELRIPVHGGPHDVAVAFVRNAPDLIEQVREPFVNPEAPSGTGGGPTGLLPAVTSVTIAGPYDGSGPGDTPSRRRVFVCAPKRPADDASCAKTILSALARRAYRGLATADNVRVL